MEVVKSNTAHQISSLFFCIKESKEVFFRAKRYISINGDSKKNKGKRRRTSVRSGKNRRKEKKSIKKRIRRKRQKKK